MDDFDTLPKMAGWHDNLTNDIKTMVTISKPTPNHKISFHAADQHGWANGPCVGSLDFNGPAMKFEGNAEESALIFFNWVVERFDERLRQEYTRGYNDAKEGKDSQR